MEIGKQIGVVVDMDPVIMTKRQKDKKAIIQKDKNTKIQKDKRTKRQKDKKTNRQKGKQAKRQKGKKTNSCIIIGQNKINNPHPPQELEQGGHRSPKF